MHIPERIARALYWKEQKLRGRALVQERLEWLQRTQFLSPREVNELQFTKLRQLLEHAFSTVPYYREVFESRGLKPADIAVPSDMQKLPILTRPILLAQQDRLLSSEADHATLQTNYSSGSTGVRAQFKQDANFRMWMRAHQLRTYQWCADWRLGQPFVLLWGSEIYWNYKQWVDRFENFITNRRELNTFRLSQEAVRSFLSHVIRFKPALISTYSNAIHLIAKEAERQKVRIPGLRAVQGTSEPMPPAFRERIAAIFGCELYDKYGTRETNVIAHESPRHEASCIQAENVFVEFIDDNDRVCAPGETGRVIVTPLNSLSMPLIRYELTDLAASVPGYCSSGLGLPRMTTVAGRKQDVLHSPTGEQIDGYFFTYLFMRFQEIHWFQVIQERIDHFFIRIYAPGGMSSELRAQLIDRIHHHTGYPFQIEFEFLAEMPESGTGKFRLCVSKLDGKPRLDLHSEAPQLS